MMMKMPTTHGEDCGPCAECACCARSATETRDRQPVSPKHTHGWFFGPKNCGERGEESKTTEPRKSGGGRGAPRREGRERCDGEHASARFILCTKTNFLEDDAAAPRTRRGQRALAGEGQTELGAANPLHFSFFEAAFFLASSAASFALWSSTTFWAFSRSSCAREAIEPRLFRGREARRDGRSGSGGAAGRAATGAGERAPRRARAR